MKKNKFNVGDSVNILKKTGMGNLSYDCDVYTITSINNDGSYELKDHLGAVWGPWDQSELEFDKNQIIYNIIQEL